MAAAPKHDVFQAVADPTRRELLKLLSQNDRALHELTEHFDMTRTAVSKHLRILSEANLVMGRKSGRNKIYQLHPEPLKEVKDWLAYYEKFWENKLNMLKHYVENDESDSNS
ncbi:helix-turn-helix transcriptional regulator [Alkalihalobacillus sp. TS-13]|uniref:ArsR/SmtB family transcription factor n=1 Tax=Alkalihalobacillus sp. TS-13 TaxID=2842455 RepID=UPI001C887C7A|nr:metalloregulator ArsR/SmtB family transcription factor [Alkalihalobacillus sp. TS-13]